jgi:hypothetical protein
MVFFFCFTSTAVDISNLGVEFTFLSTRTELHFLASDVKAILSF